MQSGRKWIDRSQRASQIVPYFAFQSNIWKVLWLQQPDVNVAETYSNYVNRYERHDYGASPLTRFAIQE